MDPLSLGNDILRDAGGGRLREHLRRMVETARAGGARVVLIAVPTLALGLRPHPVYAQLAQEMGLVLEDRLMTKVLSDRALKSDEAHPNATGYARIAERLHALLRERAALD